ncbi:MAG: AAA family ATPase [Gaiellaceae bacterium]
MRWPLVGRDELLRRLRAQVRSAQGGSVVLAGPAGVGKSRLADELARAAEGSGTVVLRVAATAPLQQLPLGALAPLLPRKSGAADRESLVWGAQAALRARSRQGPLVLLVDDAHLLDDLSAAVVHQLAATGEGRIVAVVRSGEPEPQPILALWTGDLAERVEVPPLDRDAVDRLTATVLGGAVAGEARAELWRLCRGNPLFLRELIASGLESGALVRDGELWVLRGPVGESERLAELIDARVGEVGPGELAALELVTAAEHAPLTSLRTRAGDEAVAELERRGLLLVRRDGRRAVATIGHPLYAEVIRGRMGTSRLAAVEAALAADVEAVGARRRGDRLRAATWRLDADVPTDPGLYLAAAREAGALHHPALAERLARAALAAGPDPAAELALAHALGAQGRLEEADGLLAALASPEAEPDVAAHAARVRAELLFLDGRAAEALDTLGRARRRAEGTAREGSLGALEATFYLYRNEFDQALEAVRSVLEAPDGDPESLVPALTVSSTALVFLGLPAAGLRDAERALTLLAERPAEQPQLELTLRVNRVYALFFAGRVAEAEELERGTGEGPSGLLGASRSARLGQILVLRGIAGKGAERLDTALRVLRAGLHPVRSLPRWLAYRALAAALLGDIDSARRLLEEARAAAPQPVFAWFIDRAEVWTRAAEGRVQEAVALAFTMAAESRGRPGFEALALHDAVRLGSADQAAGRLEELAAEAVERWLAHDLARHAQALSTGEAAALEAASAAFESSGLDLYAAEAAAQAAAAAGGSGSPDGLRALVRAALLASRCGGARTLALEVLAQGTDLTRRERQVAELAARGLKSREIAELLVVSVRTVDNHLHRVYLKLGLTGRKELRGGLMGIEHHPKQRLPG